MNKSALKIFLDINFIGIILIAIYHYTFINIADTDFWSRIACGSIYLKNGWVYYNDIFSFVNTVHPWVDHEWLSGIIYFYLLKSFGEPGILFLKLLIVIITMYLIVLSSYQRENSPQSILFYIIVLFALFPSFGSNIRPHSFTFLFFAFWLFLLEHFRINNCYRYLIIIPISMILWVNLHAGCISGLALIVIYIISNLIQKKPIKPYIMILIFSVSAMFLNPYFYDYFIYIKDELLAEHAYNQEWQPVDLFNIGNFLWFKLLIFLTIIGFIFSKRNKSDPVALILLISLAIIGFKTGRHNTLFAITCGIFVYEHLYDIYSNILEIIAKIKVNGLTQKLNFLVVKALPIFIVILYIPFLLKLNIINWKLLVKENIYPVNSVIFLELNKFKGNILLPFKWGSYVTWKLYPNIKVSCDGRYVEVYSLETYKENNDFYYAKPSWDKILHKYKVNVILIDKFSPICKKMLKNQEWKVVFEDKISIVLLPKNIANLGSYKIPSDNNFGQNDYLKSFFLKNKS